MKTIDLIQGSPEWHAHRATHFNASDAPAMMGCSKYKTRTQLLHELKTGIAPEVDAATQRRFDAGHRFEELARPLAAKIVGEPLYPSVGTEGELSASFDGLTMAEDIAFEHKTLNDELRAAITDEATGYLLPLQYRVQMEQQCMVAGCDKVLFMASKWSGEDLVEARHCWYFADMDLRAKIVAGWAQFAAELAAYDPSTAPVVEKIVAESVESLPAPFVQVSGELSLQDNFKVFEERLRDFLDNRLIREPKTDEDFVNLDAQIKAMKQGREALKSAKAQMLAQVQPVDQANKAADMLDKMLQQNCKMAEDLLTAEKERRRGEIVASGVKGLQDHVTALNQRLGKPYMPQVPADFGTAIRGLKSLTSMEEKVGAELTRAKIAASEIADRIQVNLGTLREHAAAHAFLFPDTAQIVQKAPEDLTTLVKARIAEHQAAEAKREEEQRERIRREEVDRIEREQEAERQRLAREQAAAATPPVVAPAPPAAAVATPAPAPTVIAMPQRAVAAAPMTHPTLSLGQIKERIAPLSITAEGLTTLGFTGLKERGSVLFHEADYPHILAAMANHLQAIHAKQAA
ncbi:endonuclease [Variovorax sp. RO1]|uniref:YqaJ viral recombinase family protein n=1 Tax=Variovorax sp. RO1 TaxID=2066034 RepID=UPI000C7181B3|nr:YqaJ viral recombinase family protein [Variovorax sp. RO1]PLC06359.1 endonuclease [Variovorax sp. RO1]